MTALEEEALLNFLDGYNCAQSVLVVSAERLGLPAETAMRLATGLGAGLGRSGMVCGAVTGAVLSLGLRFGSTAPDKSAKERTYTKVKELVDGFARQHGATNCRDLLDLDLSDPAAWQIAREQGLFETRCPLFVQTAVRLLDALCEEPHETT